MNLDNYLVVYGNTLVWVAGRSAAIKLHEEHGGTVYRVAS